MPDMEKVIKGLECCKTENCSECPYEDTSAPVGKFGTDELVACQPVLYTDALSLLKAQEQTRFIDKGDDFAPDGEIVRRWECESCGTWVYSKSDLRPGFRYCANCGKAVKWDD